MSLKLFSLFTVFAVIMAVPAVYPVPNPVGHGTGVIRISIVGMENINLTDFGSMVVNTVRLGCGTYAVYYANLNFTFSNAAVVPINASVLVYTRYNESGVLINETLYTFEVPENSSSFVATVQLPAQVSIQDTPVLPELSFSAALIQASNATLTFLVPKTISLLKLAIGGG